MRKDILNSVMILLFSSSLLLNPGDDIVEKWIVVGKIVVAAIPD